MYKRQLEIVCVLATEPKLLLLDEPAAGMNPNEMAEFMETIQLVQRRFHITILLIERDMKLVSSVCECPMVLNFSKVLKQDETRKVLHGPEVVKACLGKRGGRVDELLKMTNLYAYYDMIYAIHSISFEVKRGEIVTLIGANGAGKTITLHTITDLLPSSGGEVIYNEQNITYAPGYQPARHSLAYVPEGRKVFPQFSALQSLELGALTRRSKEERAESLRKIYRRSPRLTERKNQLAGTLSSDEQQMLAMGRALMSKSKMLVLNEPSMRLSPIYANETFDTIKSIHGSGTTILLVEQNAKKALSITNRAYALEMDTIRPSGTAEELLHNAEVRSAYLSK